MIETTITGERSRVQTAALVLRRYLDIVAGTAGAIGAGTAITILWGWPWALLAVSAALIAIALVMPRWD